jgi:dehydrogenase/reductase SDR family member 12
MTSSLLDTALDLSVIGGYTNVGYRIRSRGWKPLSRMEGKVVLITGATSGLGLAAAGGFARLGATVWLAVRNRERVEPARARIIEDQGKADVRVELCDLSRPESVRRFAERFTAEAQRLDVLVNNAGVLTQRRELSADGIELTLATNVIGSFLLTRLLVGLLERGAPSRIVNVSSGGMYAQKLRVDDLQSEQGDFDGPTVYARTKRAEVALTEMWAKRLAGTGVTVHAMHPGWAAAAEPADSSGGFWHDRRRRPSHLLPRTRETEAERSRLWAECVALSSPRTS